MKMVKNNFPPKATSASSFHALSDWRDKKYNQNVATSPTKKNNRQGFSTPLIMPMPKTSGQQMKEKKQNYFEQETKVEKMISNLSPSTDNSQTEDNKKSIMDILNEILLFQQENGSSPSSTMVDEGLSNTFEESESFQVTSHIDDSLNTEGNALDADEKVNTNPTNSFMSLQEEPFQTENSIIDVEQPSILECEISTLENDCSSGEAETNLIEELSHDSSFSENALTDNYSMDIEKTAYSEEESLTTMEEASLYPDNFALSSQDFAFGYGNLSLLQEEMAMEKTISQVLVKLPVLLGILDIEINILNKLELQFPISNVERTNLSIHSLNVKVALPSPNIFMKGELIAEIEYRDGIPSHALHTIKVVVPIEKVCKVDWLRLPILPSCEKVEYMFQTNNGDIHYVYEESEKFAEEIQSQLKQAHLTWKEELSTKTKAEILGTARLLIALQQPQYVNAIIL